MKQKTVWSIALLALLGLAAGAAFWWQQQQRPPVLESSGAPVAAATLPPAASGAESAAPGIRHPIEAADTGPADPVVAARPQPGNADAAVTEALVELLGRKAVLAFLSVDNFAARTATTVDNLARNHAATRFWPVNPTPGRFVTTQSTDGSFIGAANASRYTPFVQFVVSVNSAKAVALYKRLYPMFQHAYEELGYPGRYFNDRVVEVIDHLLETPELNEPVKVRLTEVKGPVQPVRPWVMYEFDDPGLEARSAGQKMLLRMGTANARQLKAKLIELRRMLARA